MLQVVEFGGIMASTSVLLVQLVLVSLASASHHFGGTATFTYKGRNPDGTFRVAIRNRGTYNGCQYSHHWSCYQGNCGRHHRIQRGTLDRSTNSPQYTREWCETETVTTRDVPSDKPFQMRSASCCWIPTRNSVSNWRLRTLVDLGSRSDTGKPNRSPDIAILPFLRVPQNCPRTYKLTSFDPDGDRVRCRYGSVRNVECSSCNQPAGFVLDQGSCTLQYRYATVNSRVYGFELVLEDFPQRPITLAYTDGSRSPRAPLVLRRKRAVFATHTYAPTTAAPTTARFTTYPTTTAGIHAPPATLAAPTSGAVTTTIPWWWLYTAPITTAAPTTAAPTTAAPTTYPWWWLAPTTAAPTTAAPTTYPWWWLAPTTAAPTTAAPTTYPWWWLYTAPTTAAPTTAAPTTAVPTTAAPTTAAPTTAAPTTYPWWWLYTAPTTAAPTTAAPTTYPWWWLYTAPTTAAPTTAAPTTAAPTTYPWWWLYTGTTTAAPTTAAPTTAVPTTAAPTTAAPTTAAPTTYPWWWLYTGTTTAAPTTAAPTTAAPTTYPWWWLHTGTTTAAPTTAAPTTAAPTTAAPTTAVPTTAAPTTYPWWWLHTGTTTAAPTTAAPTTAVPTTAAPTTAAPTTAAPTTYPWWWLHTGTTTAAPTTVATTTTFPWWANFTIHRYTTSTTNLRYPATTRHLHATTPPLSKLPLQFSFLVDPPAPSCQEGLYLPKFVQPTPENGARLQAEVNKEVVIRVKARAAYATVHDLIMSGPLNISKHRTTRDEFVIRWTPVADDLGDLYHICFAVEAIKGFVVTTPSRYYGHYYQPNPSSRSGIYQSEMRCVLVDVRKPQINSHVICGESTMTVEVEKASFSGLQADHLRLSDPTNTACNLRSNSTHVFAVVPLNACGTQIEEDDENLMFKNEITTADNANDLITRKHLLELQFYCQYPKRGNVTLGFTAHRRNVTVWERGFGTFTYEFEFFPNRSFQTMMDPNSYPLEYDIGSRIYMQIEATSSVNNTELFVESCRAAPYDNPNYRPTYTIINEGCKVDPTLEIHSPSHNKQFKFSMEAFKFIGLHDQVYISCSVLMCEAGNPSTRCSKGCVNSTSWAAGSSHPHHRRKREAATQTSVHFVSQGPLRLRRSADTTGSQVVHLNLNLVFIAGCLLASVGMISAVAMYKAKVSKVTYQPLPTFES